MDNTEWAFPQPPEFPQAQIERCRSTGEYRPMLFECYKYVGIVSNFLARIRIDSPALRQMDKRTYAIQIGLLNRCARLMLANVELSRQGLFGETTAIIDRCIFESAVKLAWLCEGGEEGFRQFIADGLRTEVELRRSILGNIEDRGSEPLTIEVRMLKSISRMLESSGLSEEQILAEKKLPDLASMINGMRQERLLYLIGQKTGSHHVHGNWPSLLMHYLEEVDGEYLPRDHDCPTHVNQYIFVPIVLLSSMGSFVRNVVQNETEQAPLLEVLQSITEQIMQINRDVVGADFEKAET